MARDAAEALPRAGGRGRADSLRRRGAGQWVAAAAVHPADRALHPRPRPGAARARLVRRGLRRDRVRRPGGAVSGGAGGRRAPRSPQARRAGRQSPSCAGCGRGRPTSRWTTNASTSADRRARGAEAKRPRTRSRSSSRCAGSSCRRRGSSSRPRPSSGRTRVEVPPEARLAEGAGAAGWEPAFLAATRVSARDVDAESEDEAQPDAGARAVSAFRQLITTLRLFKAGSVGLGPYAWTRAGGQPLAPDRDRRRAARGPAATASPRRSSATSPPSREPSPIARRPSRGPLQTAPARPARSARAISRFEAGSERSVVLEALNDYLLGAPVPARGRRPRPAQPPDAGRGAVRRAGASRRDQGGRRSRPGARARAVERRARRSERDGARRRPRPRRRSRTCSARSCRDAACGHLGSDLRSTADEILLADGLAVGEGVAEQRGGAEEWDGPVEPDVHEPVETELSDEALEDDVQDELYGEAPEEPEPASESDGEPEQLDRRAGGLGGAASGRASRPRPAGSGARRANQDGATTPIRRSRPCSTARPSPSRPRPRWRPFRHVRSRLAELAGANPPRGSRPDTATASPTSSRARRRPSGTCARSATTARRRARVQAS